MRKLAFDYDILLEFDAPAWEHAFQLRCIPPSFPGQEILEAELTLEPEAQYLSQTDGFGNALQVGLLQEPHERFHYHVRGTASIDLARRETEPAHPMYAFPSACTGCDAAMEDYYAALTLPGAPREKAWALLEAVRAKLRYVPGVTGTRTAAPEAFARGEGVCQDFAHVYLALARRAGLRARYANGLPEGEGASHAWCEVHLDGVWTGIDPTRGRWANEGYIRFNTGRDFTDCAIERGIFLGPANQTQTVFMKVSEVP